MTDGCILVMLGPDREYAVRFDDPGKADVWRIIRRPAISKRGYYQIETVWRRINRDGPTGLAAIHAAADALDVRAALAERPA